MKRFTTLLVLAIVVVLTGCGGTNGTATNTTASQAVATEAVNQATYTPAPITPQVPSGEWFDSTTFNNLGIVMDVDQVGNQTIGTLTTIQFHCYWGSDHFDRNDSNITIADNSDGTVTIVAGYSQYVGTYQNNQFVLTTTAFRFQGASGPVTITLIPSPDHSAVSTIEQQFNNETC